MSIHDKLDVGDVVELVSGSDEMVVTSVDKGKASCLWWYEGDIKRADVELAFLKVVGADGGETEELSDRG